MLIKTDTRDTHSRDGIKHMLDSVTRTCTMALNSGNLNISLMDLDMQPEDVVLLDDNSQMLLAPDHPLLAPIQKRLLDQVTKELNSANETRRELKRIKAQLEKAHEATGVELYTYQRQLSETQSRIEKLEMEHAETVSKRMKMQEASKVVSERLHDSESQLNILLQMEEKTREDNQAIAMQVIELAAKNEALRSDAAVRKRSVYRAEEQIKALERLKEQQDQYIADLTDELKRLQDEETYLAKQLDTQKATTSQANEILKEAYKQMETIEADIANLRLQWELTLNAIEKRSANIRTIEEEKLSEADSERAALRAGLVNTRKEIQKVRDNILSLNDQTRAKNAVRQFCLAKIDNIRNNQLAKLSIKYDTLNNSLQKASETLRKLEQAIANVVKDSSDLSLKNDGKQQAINTMEGNILVDNAEQTSGNRQLMALNAKLKSLKVSIEKLERDISKTNNEYSKCELDSITAETALETLKNAKYALQKEVAEKDALVSSYEIQINKNSNSIEQRSSAITRLNRKLEEHQRNNPESDNGPLEAMLSNLGKEIGKAIKDVKNSQSMWLKAQTELVLCQKKRDEELALLSLKEDQRDVLSRKLQEIEHEVEGANLKVKAIQREIEHVHEDIKRLNSELGTAINEEEKLNSANYVAETEALSSVEQMETLIRGMETKLTSLKDEKAEAAGCLVEVEEQILLWQRKLAMQTALLENVQKNLHKDNDGELAVLENECHKMYLTLQGLTKLQASLLSQLEQGVNIRGSLAEAGRARMVVAQTKGGNRPALLVSREIESLRSDLADKHRKSEELKLKLEEEIHRRTKLSSEVDELSQVYARLSQKLNNFRTHGMVDRDHADPNVPDNMSDFMSDRDVEGL